MLMPAILLNSSPEKCGVVPLPDEAKFSGIVPDFPSAISSLTEVAGTLGLTTRMLLDVLRMRMAAMSFVTS